MLFIIDITVKRNSTSVSMYIGIHISGNMNMSSSIRRNTNIHSINITMCISIRKSISVHFKN